MSNTMDEVNAPESLKKQHKGAIIFLHGSQDTGPGVQAWIDYVSCGDFEKTLTEHGILCVFPTAPLRQYTLLGGANCHVWFNRVELTLESLPDEDGSIISIEIIEDTIVQLEEEGIPRSKMIIGGFSMGGGLVLQCVVKGWCQEYAGLFSLSSFLQSYFHDADHSHSAHAPPLFLTHGLVDDMIPSTWGSLTAEVLLSNNYEVHYVEYPGLGHDMSRPELMELMSWILSLLADPESFEHVEELKNSVQLSDTGSVVRTDQIADVVMEEEKVAMEEEEQEPEDSCQIKYEIVTSTNDQCTVYYYVPDELRDDVVKRLVLVNGSSFELEKSESNNNVVIARFISPDPDSLAFNIAQRIESRIQDGPPPGEEACIVS